MDNNSLFFTSLYKVNFEPNEFDRLLLNAACDGKKESELAPLIIEGANVNAINNSGQTALILACLNGHSDTVSALIKLEANINSQDRERYTALMLAARDGHLDIVFELINTKKAEINFKNYYGETALMLSARKGHLTIVRALIEAGADVTLLNHFNETALTVNHAGNTDIAYLILDTMKSEDVSRLKSHFNPNITKIVIQYEEHKSKLEADCALKTLSESNDLVKGVCNIVASYLLPESESANLINKRKAPLNNNAISTTRAPQDETDDENPRKKPRP